MSKFLHRLLIGLGIAIGIYAAFAISLGVRQIGQAWRAIDVSTVLCVLALTLFNYAIRYGRWAVYLRAAQLSVPHRLNVLVFLCGFSMVITPGKIGELLKAYLLHQACGLPTAQIIAVVMAERLTDVLALVVMAALGLSSISSPIATDSSLLSLPIALGVVLSCYAVIRWRWLWQKCRDRFGSRIDQLYNGAQLIFAAPIFVGTALLACVAWLAEGIGLYLLANNPHTQTTLSMRRALFIYSSSTLGGLPSPGGLGITDGSLVWALMRFGTNFDRTRAAATALWIRLCTLWFAVFLGVAALLVFNRYYRVEHAAPKQSS